MYDKYKQHYTNVSTLGRRETTKDKKSLHPKATSSKNNRNQNFSSKHLPPSLSLSQASTFQPSPPIDYTRKLNSLLAKSILQLAKRPPSRKKSNDPPVSEPSKLYFTNRGESATFRRCMHKRSIIIHIAFSPVSTLAFIRLAFLLPLGEAKGRRSEGWRGENKWKEGSGSCAKTMAFVSTLVIHENNRASSRFLNIFSLSVCLSVSLLLSFFSLHQIHCNPLGDLRFFHDHSWFFDLALCACCFSRVAEFKPTEFEQRFGMKIKIRRLRLPRSCVPRQRSHVCRPRSHVPECGV